MNNRRIAKNAVMLYVRMFISMIVGFYTSRVVLDVLGVEDYGIYGVVGGVVAMWGFLNASMSGATSRFLTYELGRGDAKRLSETFSSALIVHMIIALIVFVLAETVGLWFLYNKLVIPEGRMTAAFWVYQLSIVSTMVGITQVPYSATIISHEKMDIYAYVEIVNVVLKLLIVYLLMIGNFDKLILYATLVFSVSMMIAMFYRYYCIRHYKETRFHWLWKKSILKPLISFSGWDLYGNGCVAVRQQGMAFLINMFFGVVYNAASSVASTVTGLIMGLVSNITLAYRPVIIKQYAQHDFGKMQSLMNNAAKVMLMLFGCMMVPCFLELPYLFSLWLVEVPPYAVVFCRLMLISTFAILVNTIVTIAIHATGNIKQLSFISGTTHLISIIVIYILYKVGLGVEMAYIVSIVSGVVILLTNVAILKMRIREFKVWPFLSAVAAALLVLVASFAVTWFVQRQLQQQPAFLRLVLTTATSIVVTLTLNYIFILDKSTKEFIASKICVISRTWLRRATWAAIAVIVAAIVALGWWFSHGDSQLEHHAPVIANNTDKTKLAPSTNDEDTVIVVDEESKGVRSQAAQDTKSVKSVKHNHNKDVPIVQDEVEADNELEISEADEEEALKALAKFSTVINKGFNQLEEASKMIEDVSHKINQH